MKRFWVSKVLEVLGAGSWFLVLVPDRLVLNPNVEPRTGTQNPALRTKNRYMSTSSPPVMRTLAWAMRGSALPA